MSQDLATRNAKGDYPVEPKVQAATLASYAATFLVTMFANIAQDEDHALLLGLIPEWAETLLLPLLPALATLAAGYAAKHQHRRPAAPAGASYRAPDGQ